MNDHYDVIIIGSGAGGGTMFQALGATGKRVLLLERGDFLTREKENWSPVAVWGQHRYRNGGPYLDRDGNPFAPKQHFYVGGNTKVYGAVLFRMREKDFGVVQHHGGVSPAWPLTYDDFEPWYTAAEHLYQVHGQHGVDPLDPWVSKDYPHPPISNEPRIQQLWNDLAARGLNPFPLPMGVLLDETSPNTSPCIRCDTCDGYPCLAKAKSDSQTICIEPALAQYPNVALRTNARVTHLETDPSGRSDLEGRRRPARPPRGVHRRRHRPVGRGDQQRRTAAAIRQRAAPERTRQLIGRRRTQPHVAPQLGADRLLQAPQSDTVPKDAGDQRLLLRRPRWCR